jgi:pseudouridine kinase
MDTAAVAAVGAASVDVLGFTAGPLIGRDSNPGYVKLSPGGVGRNIAENLARLGTAVELTAAVGDDLNGKYILESCRSCGIGTRHMLTVPDSRSATYAAIMDHEGDMALAVSDMRTAEHITPSFLRTKDELFSQAAVIIADANIPLDSVAYLLETYPQIPVCVDPVSVTKGTALRELVGSIHTLKMNLLEAQHMAAMTGEGDSLRSLSRLGGYFLARGTRRVFITLGKRGIYWRTPEEEGFYTPVPARTVNATGAGDACMAGIVYSLLHGYTLEDTARFASAAAALTLLSEETVNPTLSLASVTAYAAGRAENSSEQEIMV